MRSEGGLNEGIVKSYREIRGDGGSDVVAQVEAIRGRISSRLRDVRHVVAVASGKGGVGKSTLTLGIASALRNRDLAIAILDADLNGPSQARMAGVVGLPLLPGKDGIVLPRSPGGIGVFSIGAMLGEPDPLEFETVSSSDSHVWRASREFTALGEVLAEVEWGALDVLLVDLPPGAERTLQFAEYLGPSASFLLVTLPSELARGVVARSVTALRRTPNRLLGHVVNMRGYACAGCGELRPLFPDEGGADLGIPCLGSLPFDPELAAACDRGQLTVGPAGTPSGRALTGIAERLLDALEQQP